jgi:hypothetical protein
MTESTRPPRTRLPLSIWAVGVIAPALVWVAAVVVQLAWLPELPDSVAIHWGADGPDGFAAPWTTIALTAGLGAGLTAIFALIMATTRGAGPTAVHKLLAVVSLGTALFTGITASASLGVQRGLDDAREAPDFGGWAAAAVGVALLVAVIAWFALPKAARTGDDAAVAEPLRLSPGERSAWLATVQVPGGVIAVLVVGLGIAVAATAFAVAVAGGRMWPLLLVPVVVLALSAMGIAWRVRVDAAGLTVRSLPFGWPRRRIRLDQIDAVKTVQVNPIAEFGGWGWRWGAAGTGVVVREGQGILVVLRDGRRFTVTVDDAATGAALLAAYAASATEIRERGPQTGSARGNG